MSWLTRGLLPRLAPIILPLTVAGIAGLLFRSMTSSGFTLDPEVVGLLPIEQGPTAQQIVRATEIRFAWGSAQLILFTSMVVAAVLAFRTCLTTLGWMAPAAAAVTGSGIGAALFIARTQRDLVIMPFTRQLFGEVELLGQRWFGGGIGQWTQTSSFTEALAVPLVMLMGLGFCGLVWPRREDAATSSTGTLSVGVLKERRSMAAILLAASAVVLVSFLIEFYTIMRWPLVAVSNPEPVMALASGITAWAGVVFSLILAAMAGPVIMILSQWAGESAVAAGMTSPSEVTTWLRDEGFAFSWWQRVTEIGAVVGPSAVGIAGLPIVEALLSVLGGG